MPAHPLWFARVPEIIADLEAIELSVVDRAVIERLFGVRRRRAAQLMRAFGGYQAGRTFLVDRMQLIARLRKIEAGESFGFERERRERLAQTLEQVRRYRRAAAVVIPTSPACYPAEGWPMGVELSPGTLKIAFNQPLELLQKLFALSRTIAADYDRFEAAAGK